MRKLKTKYGYPDILDRQTRLATVAVLVNEADLRRAVANMTPRSKLFRILKEELTRLGYWRNRPRGKADISHLSGKQVGDW